MHAFDLKLDDQNYIFVAVTELNEDTQDQICDLLENLQQVEKLKNKDMRILLDKIARRYGGKVVNKWTLFKATISYSYFTKCTL